MKGKLARVSAIGLLACLLPVSTAGCAKKATQPMFSEQEQREKFKEEVSAEMKLLIDLEKKHGMNHSQVRQMKMELGLDPEKPAAEQSL